MGKGDRSSSRIRRAREAHTVGLAPGARAFVVLLSIIATAVVLLQIPWGEKGGEEVIEPQSPPDETCVHNVTLSSMSSAYPILANSMETLIITVHNTGDVNDTFNLSAEYPANWNVTFNSSVFVPVNSSVDVNFSVEVGPDEGTFHLNVTAQLLGDRSVNDTLRITIYVSRYDVQLDILDPDISASPDQTVSFILEIRNTGSLDELIDLRLMSWEIYNSNVEWPAPTFDWSGPINLFASDVTHVRLNTTVPTNADPSQGVYGLGRVRAISIQAQEFGMDIYDEVEFIVRVSRYGIDASVDAYLKEVPPGGHVKFEITVRNVGGSSVHVKYRPDESIPLSWDPELPQVPDKGWLLGDSPMSFTIGLNPPAEMPEGASLHVKLHVYIMEDEIESIVKFSAIVTRPSIGLSAPPLYLLPGTQTSHPVEVRNQRNFSIEVDFNISFAPPEWNVIPPPSILLESGAIEPMNISVVTPHNTPPGEFGIRIYASAMGEVRTNLTIRVIVQEYVNGSVDLTEPPILNLLEPDPDHPSWGNISFNLTNTGNTRGIFVVQLSDQDDRGIWTFHNWTFKFETKNRSQMADSPHNATFNLYLDPGEVALLRLNVSVEVGYEDPAIPIRLKFFVERGGLELLQSFDLFAQIKS